MMATSGGCVGPRGVLDAVDLAAERRQHKAMMTTTTMAATTTPKNSSGPSRSERLYDKEALLYNSSTKARKNNIKSSSHPRAAHQPDDDDDWGVTPTIRRGGTTPTASNNHKSVIPMSRNRSSTTTTPRNTTKNYYHHSSENTDPSMIPRAATPTERLRSFEKRNTFLQKSPRSRIGASRPITPTTRARSMEAAATSREKKRLNEKKMKRMEEEESSLPAAEPPMVMMMDITSRHHNHHLHRHHHAQQQQHQQHAQKEKQRSAPSSSLLFQSARKAITPERKRAPPKPKEKKKKKRGGLRLFEHSRREYDQRDRKRLQAIVHTVRSMEASSSNFDSSADASSIMDPGTSKYKPLIRDEQDEERDEAVWDENHYAAHEKLTAALDHPQQHRNFVQQQTADYGKNENSISSTSVTKVKRVTDWGIEAMVSDLSCNSIGSVDPTTEVPALTSLSNNGELPIAATTATQRLQQALAEAKKQIYPESDCENVLAASREAGSSKCTSCSPSPPITGGWEDKYITGDDASDTYDKVARARLYEGRKSPREELQGISSTFQQPQPPTPTNIVFHHETPKHSNTARSYSFDVNRPSSSDNNNPSLHRARSKSPDPMALSFGPPKRRSRSKTPEGLKKYGGSHWKGQTTPNSGERVMKSLTSSLPQFGRSRSVTPTKDRRHQETPSSTAESSHSRSVTPNRLWATRRKPTPGQMLARADQFSHEAEEKLKFIQRQRGSRREGVSDLASIGSFDRLSISGGADRKKPLEGIMKKNNREHDQSGGMRNGRGGISKDFGGDSAASRSTEGYVDHHYAASPRSPREPPSKRWFGRRREEVPVQDKFDAIVSSVDTTSTRGRGITNRLSSILGGGEGKDRGGHFKEKAAMSERMMKHMMTFDSLMKEIENDKKNALGAEFAVVELGDEESAVQTHAILMNRDDVEDQLHRRHR